MDHVLLVQVLDASQDLEHNALELGHVEAHLHIDEALQVVLQILEDQIEATAVLVLLVRCIA